MNSHPRFCGVIMTGEVHSYCSLGSVFNVKEMVLESVSYPILCLANIPNVAPSAFQVINEITALTYAISCGIVSFIIMVIFDYPTSGNLSQCIQVCGLFHALH